MEKLYKLIEDYLNDALPEEQRREVERRMADDETFRREVDLHRAVHEEFRDARGWSLYETMANIMQETERPPNDAQPAEKPGIPQGRRWKWVWWVIPVALVTVAGFWFFTRLDEYRTPDQPAQEPTTLPPASSDPPPDEPPTPKNNSQSENQPKDRRPIAQADPANFAPNLTMEAYVGSTVLGQDDMSVQVSTPRIADTLQPDARGRTLLRFAGAFAGLSPREKSSFNLLLFNNQNANKTIKTFLLQPSADAAGAATFDLRETVSFPKGLYYYRIEEQETGEVLVVGKFFIGTL